MRSLLFTCCALASLLAAPGARAQEDYGKEAGAPTGDEGSGGNSGDEGGGENGGDDFDQRVGNHMRKMAQRQKKNVSDTPDTGDIRPARKVESMPSSIEMRVGEKRSFKVTKGATCAMMTPAMARVAMSDKSVLTVVARKEGRTELFMFAGKSADALRAPRRIPVKIWPR